MVYEQRDAALFVNGLCDPGKMRKVYVANTMKPKPRNDPKLMKSMKCTVMELHPETEQKEGHPTRAAAHHHQ